MCSFIVLSLILHALFSSPSLLWTFISLLILLPITLAWPVLRGESWSSVRGRYGWHRGEGVLVEMGAGIGTYLAFVPALLLSVLVMTVLIKIASLFNLPGSSPTHPVINLLSGPPATLIGVYLLASVGAPLIEESMFRGALFNHLRGRHGWIISALIVSLLFAAVHPQGWTVIPPLAMLSVTFCAMREWRSSLIGSMTAHALNNGIVLTISVLMLR
jgi:membrane protease YdiL (CAAX protease family)